MASIDINAFDGMQPVVDPILLAANKAVMARNVQLLSGTLAPLLGTTTLKALTKTAPQTIWRFGTSSVETEYWLEFLNDTDVINSPLPNDQWARVYWSGGVKPKYAPSSVFLTGSSYPGASYDLGIPAPANTPVLSGSTPTVAATTETRTLVETFVSAYGEEGPPSAAATPVGIDPAQVVHVTNLSPAPTGNYNITHRRLYRSSTVGSAAQFQFVVELPIATTTYDDTITQANLGEILPSDLWVAPPDGLKGLKMMDSGACVGFVGNTVYFSEPNLPHAWPHKYPTEFNIVGLGVFGQTVVALTNSFPIALVGVDPQAMTPGRLQLPQSCVSKTSIVDTGDGVLYASPDGLVSIGAGGMSVITTKYATRAQWQAYNPSSFKAYIYEGRYHAFFTRTDGTRGILILDFSGAGPFWTESDLNYNTAVTAAYADNRTDTLYLAHGTNIERFNRGSALNAQWTSKTYRMAVPLNLAWAAVNAKAYPVLLTLYADGEQTDQITITDDQPVRLSGGFKARDWTVDLYSSAEITRVRIASSMDELKQLP
jgi:hypothetical protein